MSSESEDASSADGDSTGAVVVGSPTTFLLMARRRFLGTFTFVSASAWRAFCALISASIEEATPARDALSAISPSLVLGA